MSKPAGAKWAQRNDTLFLSFECLDAQNVEIDLKKDKLVFKCFDPNLKQNYENIIEFYKPIKTEKEVNEDLEKEKAKGRKTNPNAILPISGYQIKGRSIDFLIYKQDFKKEPYWPRLTKEKLKLNWLKVDFNRWRDEDDSDDETENFNRDFDFSKFMNAKGGLNTDGSGANFDPTNINMDDLDSDDDDLPDLNKLSQDPVEGS